MATEEALDDKPRNIRSTIVKTPKELCAFNVVKDMVEDVIVEIVEAEDGLLRTVVGLISLPSLSL
jgi:hypothetical protein